MTEERTKRLAAAVLGFGLLALAVDAGISHFAGNAEVEPAQISPVVLGAGSAVAVWLVATFAPFKRFSQAIAAVGGLNVFVALMGTFFHLKSLGEEWGEDGFSKATLEGALSVSPPVFAPAGYAAVGLLLLLLASSRFRVEVLGTRRS